MLHITAALQQNRVHMNKPPSTSRRFDQGFTLIELMITVVVLAIVVAVALPSFLGSIRKSRRSEAMAALSALQQAQERYRSNNTTYATGLSTLGIPATTSPGSYYTLSIASASATAYTVSADGTSGSQANDGQCAKLGVEVNGGAVKYAACSGSGCTLTYAATNLCWSR